MSGPARIEIVIDELVVRGLDHAEARETAAALGARLAALAEASEPPRVSREEASRRLRPLEARPDRLADAVAEAVWGALAPAHGGAR